MGDDIDDRLRDRACALRAEGLSRRQIAQALGVRSEGLLTRLLAGTVAPAWTARPNAKDGLRARARELRAEGMSYREIRAEIGVSTSTLSLWLRDIDVPLRAETTEHMAMMREARWAKHREQMARMRVEHKASAAAAVGSITDRELMLLGVMAYWCEGTKDKPWQRRELIAFINSDPRLIGIFLRWLDLMGVSRDRLVLRRSIHEWADVDKAHAHWSAVVGEPVERFAKPTIKRARPGTHRKNVGEDYHGCLIIKVRDSARLYRTVEGWFLGMADAAARDRSMTEDRPV